MGQALNLTECGKVAPREEFGVVLLNSEQVAHYWPEMAEELEKIRFVWEKYWPIEALYYRALNAGNLQIWAAGTPTVIHLFVFTQIVVFPQQNILQCFLAFGNNLRRALPVLEATLTKFAMDRDCKTIEVQGRRGWVRWLQRYGFREENVVVAKEIRREGIH